MAKSLALLLRLVVAALLALPSAQAADLAPKAEAKARFTAGESHYNLNEFSDALREFKEAYRLYPDPVFLYNLGQCERQLNHYEEAGRFYRSFLRKMPKAPNRAEVERKIDEMEAAFRNRPVVESQDEHTLPTTARPEPLPAGPGPTTPSTAAPQAPAATATEEPFPASASTAKADQAASDSPLAAVHVDKNVVPVVGCRQHQHQRNREVVGRPI
jgi:tetratricopeptide (TPR) repeat protein